MRTQYSVPVSSVLTVYPPPSPSRVPTPCSGPVPLSRIASAIREP